MEYLEGVLSFGVVFGASAIATWLLVRKTQPQLVGAVRGCAFTIYFACTLLLAHLLPLALGVLTRGTVGGTAFLVLLAAALIPGRSTAGEQAPPPSPVAPSGRLSRALSWAAVAALGTFGLAYLVTFATEPTAHVDALSFHLPNVGAWIQTGSLWRIDQLPFDGSNGYYPQNGNALILSAVLPWRDDVFVRPLLACFYAAGGVGIYALCREVRAPVSSCVAVAATFLAVPAVSLPALRDLVSEPMLVASLPVGLLFLLRHERLGLDRELVPAGLALGLAFGTKWYGVSAVLVILAGWMGARILGRQPLRTVLGQGAAVGGLVLAAGGVWLLRNWVQAGNPLFPLRPSILGWTPFDAGPDIYRGRAGFTLAHYLADPAVWRDTLVPAIWPVVALPGGLLLAVGFAGGLRAARQLRRPQAGDRRALVLAAGALALAATYFLTPYSAFGPEGLPFSAGVNVRYLIPTLILAAPLAALAFGALGRLRPFAESLALVAVAVGSATTLGAAAKGALIFAAALAALAWGWPRLPRPPLRRTPLLASAVAVVSLLAVVLGGRELQRRYDSHRFVGVDPVLDQVIARWPAGQRIGVASAFSRDTVSPYTALLGRRLGNVVRPVGHFERGFMRPERSARAFESAVRRGGYGLIVIGRGYISPSPANAEERWAREAGFRRVAESRVMALYVSETPRPSRFPRR